MPVLETGQQVGDEKQPASLGGWKIKQRRTPPEGNSEPPPLNDPDQRKPPTKKASGARDLKPRIDRSQPPLKPGNPSTFEARRPSLLSRLRLPMALVLGVIVAGAVFRPLLVQVEHWFDDTSEVGGPNQASATDRRGEANNDLGSQDYKPLVRAIALPALEDEGELPIYFKLSAPADLPVGISYETEAQTAEAGTDFAPKTGTVTIPPGETLIELAIPLIDDDVVETVEMFRLILSVDSESARLSNPQLTATVLDDDGRKNADSQ